MSAGNSSVTPDYDDEEAVIILSFMEAGPGTALLRRFKVKPPMSVTAGVTLAAVLMALSWLPLAILTIAEGDAFWRLQVPFIDDFASHVRFLFAVPILVLTEIPLARRMRHTMGHFLAARLIRERDVERFSDAIAEAGRLRDSRVAEALLVAGTVLACWIAVHKGLSAGVGTWFEPTLEGGYSLAGLWYVFISIPIFQFLLLRWVYRVVVWTRFLWHLSKIDLVLTPTHPDAAGGLMFLGEAVLPFGGIMFALSSVVAASVATKVLFAGENLASYWPVCLALIVLALVIFVGPLLIFVPKLFAVKHRGLTEYGILASHYTQAFDRKWIPGGPSSDESLLGTGDIQSLADLGNSFQMVRKMGLVPIDISNLVIIGVLAAAPALPLVVTQVPLEVIGSHMLHMLI